MQLPAFNPFASINRSPRTFSRLSASHFLAALLLMAGPASLLAQQTINYTNGENNSTNYETPPSLILNVNFGETATQSGVISGTGSVTRNGGAGTLILTGANTYTGGTFITSAFLSLGASERLADTGAITIQNGNFNIGGFNETIGDLTLHSGAVAGTGTLTASSFTVGSGSISASLAGTGAFTKSADGTLILSGDNTYSGGTTVNAGTLQIGNGGSTGSVTGNIALNNGSSIDFYRNTNTNFTGVISGDGSILKRGLGALTLSGSNTYTGNTRITGGSLIAAATGEKGTFAAGSTITVEQFGTLIVNGDSLGWGSGAAKLVLSGGTISSSSTSALHTSLQDVTMTGGRISTTGNGRFVLNGPLTTLASTSTATISANLELLAGYAAPTAFNVSTGSTSSGIDLNISSVIHGAGSLVKQGAGRLHLGGSNTYAGNTTIEAGTLSLGASERLPDATALTLNGGTLALGGFTETVGALTLNSGAITGGGSLIATAFNVIDGTLATNLAGTAALTKSGSGTVTLSSSNSYSGGTSLVGGILAISNSNQLGNTSAGFTFNGGTLRTDAGLTLTRTFFLDAGGGGIDVASGQTTTLSGVISGPGTLTKTGAGALTLSGNNTYSGGVILSAGTLLMNNTSAVPTTAAVTVNGGVLALWAGEKTIGSLAGSGGTVNLFNGSGRVLRVGGNNASTTYAGVIEGAGGSLSKTGSGTFTLAGDNTYTGGTTLSEGVLALGASERLADTGAFTLNSGTFALGDFNETIGALIVNGGTITGNGTLTASAITLNAGTINAVLGGNTILTKSGVVLTTLAGANTYTGGTVLTAGTLALGSTGALGNSGTISFNGGTLRFTAANTLDYSSRFSTAASQQYRIDTNGQNVTLAADLTSAGGSLIKSGTGTLFLTGNTTYTGGTSVTGGVLSIGDGGTTGSVGGNITSSLGGTLAFNRSDTITYAGDYSGGSLSQNGSGTLILTGNNTQGGLLFNAGTISVASANALGNGNLIFNGGTLLVTAGFTSARNGSLNSTTSRIEIAADQTASFVAFSGSGSLNKDGAGTLILTGNNNYSGGTSINAGTLQVGSGSTSGAITGNIIGSAGATLAFNRSDASTYASAYSGNGALVKSGAGTLSLTGANTHTGGTSILEGTLQIGTGSTSGSLTGPVTGNSGTTLAFNRSNAVTYSGDYSGSGALVLNSPISINVTLTGNHTHTGGTSVSAGTLNIGNGGTSGSISGNITSTSTNTMLVFNRSDASSYDGNYSGGGRLSKSGAGTLTLSGTNTFTGTTTVNAGTLRVDGSIASSSVTSIIAGARLTGSGRVGALTLFAGATLAPGNSPGTLTAGNTIWNGGANYAWEIANSANPTAPGAAGTNYDLLSISGTLTINANAGNKFTLTLASLLANNTSGDAINFNPTQNYAYTIASASGGIIGFNTNAFTINSTGFTNATNGGSWNLSQVGNTLNLNFVAAASAIPEPSTYAVIIGAFALALTIYRKQQRR